ncbi:MAG: DUF2255 family protein, partial [Mycobacterium sp.]|nr:DUF2255 family protein [Mycobacterium sp.]
TGPKAIDDAYRNKYGRRGSGYVDTMVRDAVAATTLRLKPRRSDASLKRQWAFRRLRS